MVRSLLGAALSFVYPEIKLQVENGFTMPHFVGSSQDGIVRRLIRSYIGYSGHHDQAKMEELHKRFWRQQRPQDWFNATADRLHRIYMPALQSVVVATHTDVIANRIDNVVEFGTGNGDWLAYLKTIWSGPERFLGIDLAEEQIEANRQSHPHLEFQASDLTHWVNENQTRKTLFLTNCGVLEYLSEAAVRKLLKAIQINHLESMVLFVEPIAVDFDLDGELHSRMHGTEFSFSHNYPSLLEQAGFEIIRIEQHLIEGNRMLCTVAKTVVCSEHQPPSTRH